MEFVTLFIIVIVGKYIQIMFSSAVNMGNISFTSGFFKVTHLFSDSLKFFNKKLIVPKNDLKFSFIIIPIWTLTSSLTIWFFLPIAGKPPLITHELSVLLIFSLQIFASLGFACAGLISSNYYSRILTTKKILQMSAIIICSGICILGVALNAHSFNISKICTQEHLDFLKNFPLLVIYIICAMAQNNISPFKFRYSSGLTYSSILFLFFRIGIFSSTFTSIVLIVDLFLNGAEPPFGLFIFIPKSVWFILKTLSISILFVITDATFPSYTISRGLNIFKMKLQPFAFFWTILLYCLQHILGI